MTKSKTLKSKMKPDLNARTHSLKIMSWNIHDIKMKDEGLKSNHSDFLGRINNIDIMCLQETKELVKISKYRCYNSNRTASRSGGVCICMENELSKGVRPVNTDGCDDIVAIELKKDYFSISSDIVIINAYDSPKNSSYKQSAGLEDGDFVLEAISATIAKIPEGTKIIVLGDFNARIGDLDDSSEEHFDPSSDYSYSEADEITKLLKRSSKDTKVNPNGKPFLEFVKANGLVILNGRTLGDILGEYTCIQYNGCSLVDYVSVSGDILDDVQSLKVGKTSYISDHRPITLTIGLDCIAKLIKQDNLPSYENAPLGFQWKNSNPNSALEFKKAQSNDSITSQLRDLSNRTLKSGDDVKLMNDDLISLYESICDLSLTRKKTYAGSNKKKWFDWDCRKAKRKLNMAEKKLESNPEDNKARSYFFETKKEYSQTKNKKKNDFLRKINDEIENGNCLNWKAFKHLKDQYTEPVPFDDYDLNNFFCFFKNLYRKKCNKTDHNSTSHQQKTSINITAEEDHILNQQISIQEVKLAISKLKLNKSPSLDLITNEMLKNSNEDLQAIISRLFNGCLSHGEYPWNLSVTSPLHKKGDKENPDNYRAIILGSCLGKLFSIILLDRLLKFRKKVCPDHPNQLGFCAAAILAIIY